MLKKLSIFAAIILPLYSSFGAVNLIRNPGFEDDVPPGTNDSEALYWQYDQPDTHGNRFGTAARRNWTDSFGNPGGYATSVWFGAVQGTWSDGDDIYGGFWQEAPAAPGMTYRASAWFSADTTWGASLQTIKIEFYNSNYDNLGEFMQPIPALNHTNYTQVTVSGVAPQNTEWARFVVYANNVSAEGAMRVDNVEMIAIPAQTIDFSEMTNCATDGCYEYGGWQICTGQITTNNAYSAYAASLPATNNYIQSSYFSNGVGNISFWYCHGSSDTNDEPTEAVAFDVQVSGNGSLWSTIDSVTNVLWLSYKQYSRALYLPLSHYVRIVHAGGSTNRLLIDDIAVANPILTFRYQDFNMWADAESNSCHNSANWMVCTGRITSVLADEGLSAVLAPSPLTEFTNYLRTPLMEGGYGTITFRYARGTNDTGVANLNLQSSPDGTAWNTIAAVSNIISQSYADFNQYFYHTNDAYLRILNIFSTNAGTSTILIDEGFAGAPIPPPEWTFNGVDAYTSDRFTGDAAPAIQFNDSATGDNIITPTISNPTNLAFWLKGSSTDAASSFLIEGWNGSAWVTITNMTNLTRSEDEAEKSVNCSPIFTNIRFTYTKSAGNLAFDDLLITGLPPGPKPAQQLLLDRIHIGEAELVRLQDFDAWPTKGSYGDYDFQGWHVEAGQIDEDKAVDGQAARLDKTESQHAFIRSPYFPDGLGTISFHYTRFSGTDYGTDPQYVVQKSADGNTWTTLGTPIVLTPDIITYQEYSYYLNDTTNHYIRIYHASGAGGDAMFDNVQCEKPSDRADIILNGWHEPKQPYTNDPEYVWAYIAPLHGAENWSVTSYYRIGTSGTFTAVAMEPANIVNYKMQTPIPAQPIGTLVQYYISCSFTGPGVTNSPVLYPSGGSNNPAFYIIPRERPGQVWINEINYLELDFDPEFIELAGPAGFDIGGWIVQVIEGSLYNYIVADTYVISNNTVLPNDDSGYGFFVLADSGLADRDMTLTNYLTYHYPGGVRLLNEAGGIEYAVSYGSVLVDFERIPVDEDGDGEVAVGLIGTAEIYSDFSWATNAPTPGAMNFNQNFDTNSYSFTTNIILDVQFGTTITIVTTGTNNWDFIPQYSTNLMNPGGWIPVGGYSSSYANGTNTVTFTDPNLGGVNAFYRVLATP